MSEEQRDKLRVLLDDSGFDGNDIEEILACVEIVMEHCE